jgi:Trk K+ transport system NAD-binding subunit
VPSGDDKAEPGDDALILGKAAVIREAERMVSSSREVVGTVVIAGGGRTGRTVAQALSAFDAQVKIIERDRTGAEQLATLFPRYQFTSATGGSGSSARAAARNVASASAK